MLSFVDGVRRDTVALSFVLGSLYASGNAFPVETLGMSPASHIPWFQPLATPNNLWPFKQERMVVQNSLLVNLTFGI